MFSDGTTVSKMETIEDDGYFDGACTLTLASPPDLALTLDLQKVIINTGSKQVVYTVSPQKSKEFKMNLKNVVEAK